MQQRRSRGLEFGVILLLMELFKLGFNNIPPITLLSILGQIGLYTGIINVPWDKWDVCLSSRNVMKNKEYRRLFLSAVEHGDDMHLYYNMVSFLIKGRTLEKRMGSKNFALLLVLLTVLTSSIYVGLGWACTNLLDDGSYMKTCAIGFSGVVFALKVLTSEDQQNMSMKYGVWSELVLIYLLVPGSSFMGHLAGILAGLTFNKTRLGGFMKKAMETITGDSIHGNGAPTSSRSSSYSQSYRQNFFNPNPQGNNRQPPNYGWGHHRQPPPNYGWNVG